MQWLGIGALSLSLGLGISACKTHDSAESQLDAGTAVICAEDGGPSVLGVASASLDTATVHLDERVELVGPNVARIFSPESSMLSGLRWQQGRLIMLADKGFWGIDLEHAARWYATSTVLVLNALAADLDGDGDQDMLLLSMSEDGCSR